MADKKEIIITGVNGFVGGHLTDHLHDLGYLVHGVGREELAHDGIKNKLDTYIKADLLDEASVKTLFLKETFAIIHLAGLASVADSFKHPTSYMTGNGLMTNNLLSTALEQGFKGRVVVISTGAIYDAQQPMPLSENSKTSQSSPYAVGKLFAEGVSIYHKHLGMDVVIVRPFNHIGPGQAEGFLLPDLYQQIVTATHDGQSSISTGNLTTRRDYTDVRDIVKAYTMLATADSLKYDIYNVSSGKSFSGEEILDELKRAANSNVEAIVDQARVRPTDATEIVGDASRIKDELGWQPTIPISKTIADFVASKG